MQNPPGYNPGYNPGYQQPQQQQQYMPVQQLPVAQVTRGAHPIAARADGKFTELDVFKTTGQRFANKEYKLAFCPPLTGCMCGCLSLKIGTMALALLDVCIGAAWTVDFFEMWMGSWSRYSERYGYFNRAGGVSFFMFPILPMIIYVLTSLCGVYGAFKEIGILVTVYMCGVVFGVILFAIYTGQSLLWYYFATWGVLVSLAFQRGGRVNRIIFSLEHNFIFVTHPGRINACALSQNVFLVTSFLL
eukprot:GEMP01053241.1.p1 GENE.GEMP01053241.1~~GEMP01053241.1.p1  ORF type:complete len:246 (+),score=28.44 GEMP01053241.1:168-905(+)